MATKIKHKKLSLKRAFTNVKPVSYTKNDIISELMRDQEAVVAKYMGTVKPKKRRGTKK
jgi:hypothetical protein